MGTSADKPYVDVIYKLCETTSAKGDFSPIMKLSEGKATLPGRKQVFRFKDRKGFFAKDVIALADEKTEGAPLLVKVMENGKITRALSSLNEVRAAASENLSKLPEKYKKLTDAPPYPVELSQALEDLIKKLRQKLTKTEILNPP
jgi:nicotinate phosphoribosyltransferase